MEKQEKAQTCHDVKALLEWTESKERRWNCIVGMVRGNGLKIH